MRPMPIAALVVTLALPALAGEAAYRPPSPPSDGRVLVYRGSGASAPSAVPVYRGSAGRATYLAESAPAPEVLSIGGRHVWFVDPARSELTACRLVNTFTVGVTRIGCVERPLPVQ